MGRSSRTPAGTSANRSSTESAPIAASISRRSASVTDVYRLTVGLVVPRSRAGPRLLQGGLVGVGVHQLIHLGGIRQPHPDEPALAVGIVVDRLGTAAQRIVDLDDLPGHGRDDVGDRLHGLDLGIRLVLRDRRADLGRVEEDDLAELLLGGPGDAAGLYVPV